MGRIVYHGTLSDQPPHTYGYPFHVGTEQAAWDRLDDEVSHGVDIDETGVIRGAIHKYEIGDSAPMSKRTWDDPMFYQEEGGRPVPEDREDKIYPYNNSREDSGSLSYVVPHTFVGNHVKHLGTQFDGVLVVHPAITKAATVMLGGEAPF